MSIGTFTIRVLTWHMYYNEDHVECEFAIEQRMHYYRWHTRITHGTKSVFTTNYALREARK